MGVLMKINARDRSFRSTVDCQIEEAHLEENLSVTSDARGQLAAAEEHMKTLQEELNWTWDAAKRADERAVMAETNRDEALA